MMTFIAIHCSKCAKFEVMKQSVFKVDTVAVKTLRRYVVRIKFAIFSVAMPNYGRISDGAKDMKSEW